MQAWGWDRRELSYKDSRSRAGTTSVLTDIHDYLAALCSIQMRKYGASLTLARTSEKRKPKTIGKHEWVINLKENQMFTRLKAYASQVNTTTSQSPLTIFHYILSFGASRSRGTPANAFSNAFASASEWKLVHLFLSYAWELRFVHLRINNGNSNTATGVVGS